MVNNNQISDTRGSSAQLMPTTMSVNSSMGTTQVVYMNQNNYQSFYYNPMTDYLEWYGLLENTWGYLNMNISSLQSMFTNVRVLNEYLELHARDTILVQKCSANTWGMYFRNNQDKELIQQFHNEHTPTHIRLLSWPDHITKSDWPALMTEVEEWSTSTLQEPYTLNNSYHAINGSFKSEHDAALFKLKWTTA